eukprot:TRINITY_DN2843_c0_g1_i3.p1 TRINITY_DN2843_c0_g1~~TRINITY_DN2843_c0_g1_i3.p1  ORF type:complete len:1015 (-),score=290.33 TRINITY_DN2843_c0_g1_i3:291-3335(-)
MADTLSIILDYLQRHHFTKAEAALRAELSNRQGSNGSPSLAFLEEYRSVNTDRNGQEFADRGDWQAETDFSHNEDERMRRLTEDIAFDEDRLLLSEEELYPQIEKIHNQSRIQRTLPDHFTDSELIVKEIEGDSVSYSQAGEHRKGRKGTFYGEEQKEPRWIAQRTVFDASGVHEVTSLIRQDIERSKNAFNSTIPNNDAWGIISGNKEQAGSSSSIGNTEKRKNKASRFSELEQDESSLACKDQDEEAQNRRNKSGEPNIVNKLSRGISCEGVDTWSLSNPTSEFNNSDGTLKTGPGIDRKVVCKEDRSVHKNEERFTYVEYKNDTAEGKSNRVSKRSLKSSDKEKQNIFSFEDPSTDGFKRNSEGNSQFSLEKWNDRNTRLTYPFVSTAEDASNEGEVLQCLNRKQIGDNEGSMNELTSIKPNAHNGHVSLHLVKAEVHQKNLDSIETVFMPEKHPEEFPRLPPVRLKSGEKTSNALLEGIERGDKSDRQGSTAKMLNTEASYLLGSFLDVPVGQEITVSGGKRTAGSGRLSVSQGITEDASELVSGNATVGDGLSETIDYPNEYWDSDEYEDDDDLGYIRQTIEDEAWFLAHEIDYPSDNEKGTGHGSIPDQQEREAGKEDDDQSFVEEDSYFSGEQYFQSKNIGCMTVQEDHVGHATPEIFGQNDENDLIAQYDGQLMDEEELNLMRSEPVWQGFVTQSNELVLGSERVISDLEPPQHDDVGIDDDQHGSVRSIGAGIHSDAADFGSEVRESLVGGSSEGDAECFHDREVGASGPKLSKCNQHRGTPDTNEKVKNLAADDSPKFDTRADSEEASATYDSWLDRRKVGSSQANQSISEDQQAVKGSVKRRDTESGLLDYGGFSFPSPSSTGDLVDSKAGPGKSLWSTKGNITARDDTDDYGNDVTDRNDVLAPWRRKSNESSPVMSPRDENLNNAQQTIHSTGSAYANYELAEKELRKRDMEGNLADRREDEEVGPAEDEEAIAVQEQVRQIKAQEDEFETFSLKIIQSSR